MCGRSSINLYAPVNKNSFRYQNFVTVPMSHLLTSVSNWFQMQNYSRAVPMKFDIKYFGNLKFTDSSQTFFLSLFLRLIFIWILISPVFLSLHNRFWNFLFLPCLIYIFPCHFHRIVISSIFLSSHNLLLLCLIFIFPSHFHQLLIASSSLIKAMSDLAISWFHVSEKTSIFSISFFYKPEVFAFAIF